MLFHFSYGQLTQIHPDVDEYKLYYAQVGDFSGCAKNLLVSECPELAIAN